mmetsp:Transcript_18616/g.40282  ORF Transcript_18616/g.40282 Transcript_18616/m.40282 type:complete len:369 (+) Transcript_18616:225-1331(+)
MSGACRSITKQALVGLAATAGRHSIHDLSAKAALKVPGSESHRKLWRHYCHRFCEDVQAELRRDIGSEVDARAARSLEAALGAVGADQGIMPDFSDEAALRGYSHHHFGRARLLGDLMSQNEPEWLESRVADLFSRGGHGQGSDTPKVLPSHVDLVSLGGGPGYDYVAAAALSEYRSGPSVRAKVYEYEKQWRNVVSSVERATHSTIFSDRHSCDFGGCDITLPLGDSVNAVVAQGVNSENKIFTCSYCVAENAVALRGLNWVFFRDIFEEAREGTLFFVTDTTHRLWPELAHIAKVAGLRFATPHLKSGKVGCQFVAMKDGCVPGEKYYSTAISKDLLARFKADNDAHLHRLGRGWKREDRKIRGAK